jgi:hypothetical protein
MICVGFNSVCCSSTTASRTRLSRSVPGDITDRKRAEEALREIAERYECQSRVFDTTLSGITDLGLAEHVRWILEAKQRYHSAICCNKAARPRYL